MHRTPCTEQKKPAISRGLSTYRLGLIDQRQQRIQAIPRIAVEHARVLFEEQRVFDTGVDRKSVV